MSAALSKPRFVEGSTFRHVVIMTLSAAIGLIAIFAVDLLNLFYLSLLKDPHVNAAVGFSAALNGFMISLNIGVMIACSALVARHLGAHEVASARRISMSSLVFGAALSLFVSGVVLFFLKDILRLMGAQGHTFDLAYGYLLWVLPSSILMGIGMVFSACLRAVGDAKRSMWVTLGAGLATAAIDPIFIFVLNLGMEGAGMATAIARFVLLAIGAQAVLGVHHLMAPLDFKAAWRDASLIGHIAFPAILTNIATPVAGAYVTSVLASYGDAIVAGSAVADRLVPVAFGTIFALSGAVGPIMAQNLGAKRYDRVQRTLRDGLIFTIGYVLLAWLVLYLSQEAIIAAFHIQPDAAVMVRFFCTYVAGSFLFLGSLFVANACFNNLGYPLLSTAFNWGRATFGTVPFVLIGAKYYGALGVVAGQAVGAALFGLVAIFTAFSVVRKIATRDIADLPKRV